MELELELVCLALLWWPPGLGLLLHNKSVNTFSPLANRRAHYNGAGIASSFSKCLWLAGIGVTLLHYLRVACGRIELPFLGSFMNCFNAHLPVDLMGALPSYIPEVGASKAYKMHKFHMFYGTLLCGYREIG